MTIKVDSYPPLFQEYYAIACKVYPAFIRRLAEGIKVGYVPDVVEGMMSMRSNLGHDRYKALDTAFRNADEQNLEVLRQLTGMTKKQWGQTFWGWSK